MGLRVSLIINMKRFASIKVGSMPVLSGRAARNSQHAGALPATGFATDPMYVGVGG